MPMFINRGIMEIPAAPAGFVRCSGTPIIFGSPNANPGSGWDPNINSSTTSSILAPDGSNDAFKLVASVPNFCFMTEITEQLTGGVTHSLMFYAKSLVGSGWIIVGIDDGTNSFTAPFNLLTGAVGATSAAGAGAITCSSIGPAANGYYQCSLAGSLPSTVVPNKRFFLSDSDTVVSASAAQEVAFWQVGT